jgi:hypothetical protein
VLIETLRRFRFRCQASSRGPIEVSWGGRVAGGPVGVSRSAEVASPLPRTKKFIASGIDPLVNEASRCCHAAWLLRYNEARMPSCRMCLLTAVAPVPSHEATRRLG